MIAVINSGPLIALAKLNELRVLPALYGTVIIPQAVYTEAVVVGLARGYQDAKLAQIFLKRMRWEPEPITERISGFIQTSANECAAMYWA